MSLKTDNTKKIKEKALQLGFTDVGISKAGFLDKESFQLKDWLKEGSHGEMHYMENHFEKRTDPRKLIEGAKSVISVLLNYYPREQQKAGTYKISKYAYGTDYHYVLKEKLKKLLEFIQSDIGEVNGRAFVDSAPVMDKAWAAKSGLGWQGKHTNLISPKYGSFVFIGELIVDMELDCDQPTHDLCSTCTKCLDACPTDALGSYKIDARKCISYLTIEKKGELPTEMKGQWNDWIFGCDICQDVCPWNRKSKPYNEPAFNLLKELLTFTKKDWHKLEKPAFKKLFKNSPIQRTKFEGLKRNIDFLKNTK